MQIARSQICLFIVPGPHITGHVRHWEGSTLCGRAQLCLPVAQNFVISLRKTGYSVHFTPTMQISHWSLALVHQLVGRFGFNLPPPNRSQLSPVISVCPLGFLLLIAVSFADNYFLLFCPLWMLSSLYPIFQNTRSRVFAIFSFVLSNTQLCG